MIRYHVRGGRGEVSVCVRLWIPAISADVSVFAGVCIALPGTGEGGGALAE
jgi:hypothetical protein